MRNAVFILPGILFGIVMTKSEAISWYRIQEMFLFESFHMYGIIGTAIVLGAVFSYIAKRYNFKSRFGHAMDFNAKPKKYIGNLVGGIIFGLGWALTGACPGPLYVLIGNGALVFLVVILSAVVGALTYGIFHKYFPQ